MENKFLAIDVGGTKVEVCLFDENYNLLTAKKTLTDSLKKGNLEFIEDLKKIIKNNLTPEIKKIGVSFNCVINQGIIIHSSLLGGTVNYSLEKEFRKIFGLPVSLENDVQAMALAEDRFGQGQGKRSFLLINLGTGIRIAHVYKGGLIRGFNNNAGEICLAKIIVPEFKNLELEIDGFLSGRGLTRIYWELTGRQAPAQKICEELKDQLEARQALEIFINHFSKFLGQVSFFFNPELIIISGSMKKSADLFLPQAVEKYKKEVPEFFHFKDIVLSKIDAGAALGSLLV